MRTGGTLRVISGRSGECSSVIFTEDMRLLAVWENGAVQLVDIASSEVVASAELSLMPNERCTTVKRLDSSSVAVGTDCGGVTILHIDSKSCINVSQCYHANQDSVVLDIRPNQIIADVVSVTVT